MTGQCVLMLSCPDTPGIVYAVAGFLADRWCTIVQSQQFDDPDSSTFFMRVQFAHADGQALSVPDLRRDFEQVASRFGMTWRLVDAHERQRVLIMVSRFGHCLNDLLYRDSVGELNIDVAAVVSNHPDLAPLAGNYGVPFQHIPVTPDTKPEAEARLLEIVQDERIDLVVLARYMQILSPELCKHLDGRAINIHHSMLPSFKGARPYHQAHARGVKVVGATAHYVTADLDEGPIIEQQITRVDHSMTAEEFAARGREVECRALARAVRWHTENRVALNGHKTVVLR
ncbi:formyltetrahydrofolate deformylase [Thermocatellispora tengchongensis]|uniref:Formyltetrahydrofolate deformylase n=1 Tax=Thermocatellispora tengchongensis TaxID=1073253 RepID=A0A840P9F3_9ACTN|nr:formyltetrahydrofolate deformylase [Thermocatellispora tengchongensis]MBB5134543.1 formyltetrahydrofolate deformylase [Thermocatellispora tengchongensis]